MLPKFNYVQAKSVADAIRLLAAPGAKLHAGGTDLLGCLRDRVFAAETIVSISGLSALQGVAVLPSGGLRIGALTTNAAVAADARVAGKYRALAQAAASVASPQLRNQGTIGGNLCQRPRCWYFRGEFACLRKGGDQCFAVQGENEYHGVFGGENCYCVHPSDIASALVALGAKVRIAGAGGSRLVPIGSFFLSPAQSLTHENVLQKNEVLTEILLPPPPAGLVSSYRKVRTRGVWDFALAGAALALVIRDDKTVQQARIVLSGAAPIPWRAEAAERAVTGKTLTPEVVEQAAAAAVAGAEPMEKNAYKLPLIRGAVAEALTALA